MKKKDLLNQYSEKTFQKTFSEKEKALDTIGTPKEQINTKKQQYDKLFKYDKLVFSLREKILKYDKIDIDNYISSRISFHFSQINIFITLLNNLDFSNPNDINIIFTNFDIQAQAYNNFIIINASGKDITSGKTIFDEYIKEVRDLLKELSTFNFKQEGKNVENAVGIAKKLTDNKDKYEKAIQTAERWIQAEGNALSSSLKNKAEIFEIKATEHNHKKTWWWFVGGIIGGIIAIFFMFYFIDKTDINISMGASLLRMSILIIISYFSFYCMQQFSNQRKFYEIYKFKAIALTTMEELLKSYTERLDREKILNKAISIIFNEPRVRDDRNLQKKALDEIIGVIKRKL